MNGSSTMMLLIAALVAASAAAAAAPLGPRCDRGTPSCSLGFRTILHRLTPSGCEEICVLEPSLESADFKCGYCSSESASASASANGNATTRSTGTDGNDTIVDDNGDDDMVDVVGDVTYIQPLQSTPAPTSSDFTVGAFPTRPPSQASGTGSTGSKSKPTLSSAAPTRGDIALVVPTQSPKATAPKPIAKSRAPTTAQVPTQPPKAIIRPTNAPAATKKTTTLPESPVRSPPSFRPILLLASRSPAISNAPPARVTDAPFILEPILTATRQPLPAPTTNAPVASESSQPTKKPAREPTTKAPVFETNSSSKVPVTSAPMAPAPAPTIKPSLAPAPSPTNKPSMAPATMPSNRPTSAPVLVPTDKPSKAPVPAPTNKPSNKPLPAPTNSPSKAPTSNAPVPAPTNRPVKPPTKQPSASPMTPAPVPVSVPVPLPAVQSPVSSGGGAGSVTYVPGELTVQENGLLLSTGLKSKLIGTKDRPVQYDNGGQSSALFHKDADAGAVFVDPNTEGNPDGWIYVNNAEVQPFNGVPEGQGGVGAFTFDKDGEILDYKMVLQQTTSNCAGGRTPWNTWVSCEEYDNGRCWQVDPTGQRAAATISMTDTGRGKFEAFAFDVRNANEPHFFVTKDDEWGELRRFTPDATSLSWDTLHGTGKLDYLVVTPNGNDNGNSGTYEWVSEKFKGAENAKNNFPNAEGIDVVNNQLFFVSKTLKAMFILDLDGNSYTKVTTTHGLFDGQPDQVQRIIGSDSGLLYFTEDGGEHAGVHARNSQGQFMSILESHEYTDETTGLAFSPNGKYMYIAYQDNGLLFQVWREDGLSFDAQSLNVKFHSA